MCFGAHMIRNFYHKRSGAVRVSIVHRQNITRDTGFVILSGC